jgi:hypothetical protein
MMQMKVLGRRRRCPFSHGVIEDFVFS